MKLRSLKLTNFRGYKDTVEILFDNLTAFVGKNDIGKSTILEALDIFFNDGKGTVKLDKQDVNVGRVTEGNTEIVIGATFCELPDAIVIDSTYQTSLADEYMLNTNRQLEIVKKYKNGGAAKVFMRAHHPSNPVCADLLMKKNADLKRIIQSEGIECENQAVNAVMRAAIWERYADDLQLREMDIDVTKEDAKKIWDKLSTYLPVYSLFQSDRKNSDGDSEVQDPLKEAVKQILNDEELQATLASVANVVQQKLSEVASRTLDKLREMDAAVANSLNPVIPPVESLKWIDVFKNVSITGDQDIPINKRGSGVKRLVLLNFFRAEAERRAQEGNNTGIIYAIEEPETSQHTANQNMLVEAFKTLSEAVNTQVILTTHSANIVKRLEFSDIRMIEIVNGEKIIRNMLPGQLRYPSLNEVNYTAFGEITEEYHDELYNFLEFQQWISDYKQGKPTRQYIQIRRDRSTTSKQYTLTEIIRHQIHHGDNHYNVRFTQEELAESIELMREYIRTRSEEEAIWDPEV